MDAILNALAQIGIEGIDAIILTLLILGSIFLGRWMLKITQSMTELNNKVEEIESDVGRVHNTCHIPRGAVKALEEKVIELEKQDVKIEGDVQKIEEHLKSVEVSVLEIKTDVKTVLNYLIKKGIDNS